MLVFDEFVSRKETKMHSYAYEVIVRAKMGKDGEVLREAAIIDSGSGLLEQPTREKLLLKNAAKLAEIDPEEEVVVNIRPFCA